MHRKIVGQQHTYYCTFPKADGFALFQQKFGRAYEVNIQENQMFSLHIL